MDCWVEIAHLLLFSGVQLRPRRTRSPYECSICYSSIFANPPPRLRRSLIYYIPVVRDMKFQAMRRNAVDLGQWHGVDNPPGRHGENNSYLWRVLSVNARVLPRYYYCASCRMPCK